VIRVVFRVLGVPENWGQITTPTRGTALAKHQKMAQWQQDVAIIGNRARKLQEVPSCAEDDPPRRVLIHQDRHGILDQDGLDSSVKPIIDGLKRRIRKGANIAAGDYYYRPGAFLLWDDNPKYISDRVNTQEKIPLAEMPMITVVVEIP
jgi:hypothetical protein